MQVHFAHQPLAYDNFAGVVVYSEKEAYIECTTYRDQNTESGAIINYYQWIKVIKKDYRYTFYGSTDGKLWTLVGSALSRGSLIGFFLRCLSPAEKVLRIDNIEFYASNFITLHGIKSFFAIELYNAAGALVLKDEMPYGTTQYDLDTTQFILPLTDYRLRIFDPNGGVIYDGITTLNAGDVFDFDLIPKFAWLNRRTKDNYDGLLLNNETNQFDLGRLEGLYTYHTVTILTNPDEMAFDTNVYIEPFLYNSHVSEHVWLALAEDEDEEADDSIDETRWVRRVNIRQLSYTEPAKVLMRIKKDFTHVMLFDTTRYKFKLIIE
jgi:hypothetical protein